MEIIESNVREYLFFGYANLVQFCQVGIVQLFLVTY